MESCVYGSLYGGLEPASHCSIIIMYKRQISGPWLNASELSTIMHLSELKAEGEGSQADVEHLTFFNVYHLSSFPSLEPRAWSQNWVKSGQILSIYVIRRFEANLNARGAWDGKKHQTFLSCSWNPLPRAFKNIHRLHSSIKTAKKIYVLLWHSHKGST